jgi:hypothetical protein
LDAADMGVVEVDPAELARYRAKQKQTHNRYIQKRQAMMNKGSRENTHLKPGTPTWIGDADWDAVMQRTFLSCKLQRVPHLSAAQAFVVMGRGSASSHYRSRCIIGRGPCGLCRTHCPPTGSNHPVRSRAQSAAGIVDFERCPKHVAKHHRLDQEGGDACGGHHHGHALDANQPIGLFSWMAAQGRPDHRRRQELVALVTATEKAGLPAHEKRHCQSLSEFAANCRQFMI